MDAVLLSASRKDRGLALSRDKRLKAIAGTKWYVPSQSNASGGYIVDLQERTCTCPDHEETSGKCKHAWAVEFVLSATVTTTAPDGSVSQTTVRVTYGQSWSQYNAAQTTEREHVGTLLRALCEGVTQPRQTRGRPRLPLSDLIHAATMKVYTGMSARRAASDIRDCASKGLIDKAPHFNSIHNVIERPDVTPLLKGLIEESAAPLKSVEASFAIDSTGFSTCVYHRWFDKKYGREKKEQTFVKAHAMVGVATKVITAVEVTDETGADSPQLPALVQATAKRFDMDEVSADKAYLSRRNVDVIEGVGAVPFIPFKINSTGTGSEGLRRMHGLFMFRRDEFLRHYHKRSNVESAFSAIKRKFGGSVKARLHEAQVNEVLLKCLCHNLSCVVHAMYELGIEPTFWVESSQPGGLQ